MSETGSADELLAAVEASPRAVAAHDRAAWVGLFASGARVEDPVGSRPHIGREAIERFYDTFIAPNGIVFRVEHDVVCGTTVFRDLGIETTMSTGVTLRVPMHLRYDLERVGEVLRIRELHAHWELPVMIVQLLAAGVRGLGAAARLAPQLLGNQGIGGALGFARGFVRVGSAGKRVATGLIEDAARGDVDRVRAALTPDAVLEWPAGVAVDPAAFVAQAAGTGVSKPIAAGRYVTVSVETTAGRGIAELVVAHGGRISAVRVYVPG
ncbi:nuclear transport factor 2 family protein [Nocardia vaccinii]|uniref:nuclear transport factor 2 family protein n=1 Tax=Nocardia vaccinii TaxID=1822 RepID=UPI000AD16875|nr:nuclear transport factor 2 family protein [Nocardia vaccinii]